MSLGSRRHRVVLIASAAAIFGTIFAGGVRLQPDHGRRTTPLPTEIIVRAEETLPRATAPSPRTLRVCADPNNLPFSNSRGEGFENKLAELMAGGLGRQVQYYWQPQRRGFIRSTLRAGACDVVMGMPAASDMVLGTRAYYRSTYVFVSRRDRRLRVRSFDDPRLRRLRIGIQITGADYDNPPPAQALAARHIVDNIRGFTVYGDYSKPYPLRGSIDAVQTGSVDLAVIWGPVAGYFGHQPGPALDIAPVPALEDGPSIPFAFNISMAVRKGDEPLAAALNKLIAQRGRDIRRILDEYHVPRVEQKPASS